MEEGAAHRAQKDLRFIVIGAGMAGILCAIKLKEAGYRNVAIFEKADRVGGTWRENTYPGLTCDVPSHSYTYSFAPNPDWTRHFPGGPEIYAYFEGVAQKYGVTEQIQFNEEIVSCVYGDGLWTVETKSGIVDQAEYVLAATGVLHHPAMPDIPGIDSFEGAIFHSARWDHTVPLDGKRIAVVGSGSTGVQIVSGLAERAGRLQHFQRSPQWIIAAENTPYTEEERASFRANPGNLHLDEGFIARTRIFSKAVSDANSAEIEDLEARVLANLETSVTDPVLREKLRPTYRAACKRIIMSPDYYEKIQMPAAELVTAKIERIEAKGIRTTDGQLHEQDVIALATGFKADMFLRPMNVVGRGGVQLNDLWAKRPSAYLAVSLPDFPNLFLLNGPTGPVGNFSLIDIAEQQLNYIFKLIDATEAGGYREISVTREAMADYDKRRIERAKGTIFASGCKSWYLDAEGVPTIWPWTFDEFRERMAAPDFQCYEMIA